MADTTGTVRCIQIRENWGALQLVEDGTGDVETFFMWAYPDDVSAFSRVLHSMWLSILRDAFTAGSRVRILHDAAGGFVEGVELTQ